MICEFKKGIWNLIPKIRGVKRTAHGKYQAHKQGFVAHKMILQSIKASCNFLLKEIAVLNVSTWYFNVVSALQTSLILGLSKFAQVQQL